MIEQMMQTFITSMSVILGIALIVIAFGLGAEVKKRFDRKAR